MTFRQWLNNNKWRFGESRMIPTWNVLDQLADSIGVNGGGFTFGTQQMGELDLATNVSSVVGTTQTDVLVTTPDAGQLSTITGGVAMQKAPPALQFR